MRKYLPLLIAFIAVAVACSSDDGPAPSPQPAVVPATATDTVAASPTPTTVAPTVNSIVLTILVAELAADLPGYDRDNWRHWTDADGDCQNTRHETLIEESRLPVAFKDERRCQVASGEWVGPYTGTLVTEASDLDIDHMVPLANAHRSGGWQWPEDRKERYANHLDYPGHLVAATQRANRSKSDKGPEAWRPDVRGYWCQYALDWIEIKRSWELTATPAEADALREMVESCEMQVFIQVEQVEPALPEVNVSAPEPAPTVIASPTAAATATPSSPTVTPVPDYNCSDFDTWQEAQDFFLSEGGPEEDPHNLDRNSDGVVCESLPGAPGLVSAPTATPIATATAAPEPTLTPTATAAPTMTPAPTSTTEPTSTATAAPTPTPVPAATATPTPTPVPTATAAPTMTPTPPFEDRNCSDFDTWQEAQDFFLAEGGPEEDPHRLDRNRDGVACESLPGAP